MINNFSSQTSSKYVNIRQSNQVILLTSPTVFASFINIIFGRFTSDIMSEEAADQSNSVFQRYF